MLSLLVSGLHAALLAGPPVARGFARYFGKRRRAKLLTAPSATTSPALTAASTGSAPRPLAPPSWARCTGARPEPLGSPPRTVLAVDGYNLLSAADYEALFALCSTLGLSVDALMILMRHESHLDATAWNGIAAGLVQITKDAGVPGFDNLARIQAIASMTPREQFAGPILTHFKSNPRIASMSPGELLLWNFTPAFFGKSEDTVISRKGERIYEANYRALDKDNKGSIQVGDLYRAAERICAEARGRRAYPDGRLLEPAGGVVAPTQGTAPLPRAGGAPRPKPAAALAPSTPVDAVWDDGIWYPALIVGVAGSGKGETLYTVAWKDGSGFPDSIVPASKIRPRTLPEAPPDVAIVSATPGAAMPALTMGAGTSPARMPPATSPAGAPQFAIGVPSSLAARPTDSAASTDEATLDRHDEPMAAGESPPMDNMQLTSSGPEDDDATATNAGGDEEVIERFKWTIQYDTTLRDGSLVRADGARVEMRYAGIDGATRRVPVDLGYTPPSLDDVPPGLQRAATVPTEVGFAARALLGWLGGSHKPYGTVIPFEIGGTRYAARIEKHSNAAVGLSIFLVTGELSSGGPDVDAMTRATGILLAAVQAGTTEPVTWTWVRVEDDLEVLVMDDALKCEVGGVPQVRAPVSWAEMRDIARLLGCVPPLKEWVDAIHAQATFHPTFVGLVQKPGDDKLMNTIGFVLRYHQQLEAQLAKAGVDTSATFVEPIAKWWIFSDRMPNWETKYGVRGVAGLYGSPNTDGSRIQPDSAVHDANHSDYSMVCRLVSAWGRRPSRPGDAVDLMALMQQKKPQLAAYMALFQRES